MTTSQKALAIEAKIRETCPELRELSFGCAVDNRRMNGSKVVRQTVISYKITKKPGILDQMLTAKSGRQTPEQWGNITNADDIKIIGHPIHLEHLLRTFANIAVPEYEMRVIGAPSVATLIFVYEKKIAGIYKLNSSFSENMKDEQLVEFIYHLICE